MAHGAAGSGGGGRTQLLVAVEVPAMTVLTVSSPVFFSLFSFSFSSSFTSFSSLGSLLSIPFLLLSSFSLFLFFFLFSFCFPSLLPLFFLFFLSLSFFVSFFFLRYFLSLVFIGKKQGERGLLPLLSHGAVVGRPLCSRPRTAQGVRPLYFSPSFNEL